MVEKRKLVILFVVYMQFTHTHTFILTLNLPPIFQLILHTNNRKKVTKQHFRH